MKKNRLIFLTFFTACICFGYANGMEKNSCYINKENMDQKKQITTKKKKINPHTCLTIKDQYSGGSRLIFLLKRDPVDTKKVKKPRTDINFVFKSVEDNTTQERGLKRAKVACNSSHKYVENYDESKEFAFLIQAFERLFITERHPFAGQRSN